ncbi:MAG: SDR family NAD(P)-dependent oxidoreductase [Clostridia bacterium]|nr:SDR family NAD(P)-dependent oxidoreductase [Clostridia bacterium]
MDDCKSVAILTGATGGLGYAFIKELVKEPVDEIWAVGRNADRLDELVKEFGDKIVPFRIDLTKSEEISSFNEILKERKPHLEYLINNAGIAQMKPSKDLTISEIESTIDLNCKVPTILTNLCLPYMKKGSKIVNICSASAFQPVPYINLYASTKAFERSYSRALNVELKPLGITVTAVCPSWIDTGMLVKEINGHKVKFNGLVTPAKVAKRAIIDSKKGKAMSVCTFYVKCQHLNVKLMPQKLTMKIWTKSIKKYL